MESITRRTALGAALAVPAAAFASTARAAGPTEIDLFFPVPVQGMLASKMRELIDRFNTEHPDLKVTAVYTGSYDDTNLKTRAAIKAGRPPGAVIMSANFVREYVINEDADALDPLIEKDGKSVDTFMDQFWLTSPEVAGEWSRFTGYFAPRKAAYDLPEMKEYLQQHPDAKVALDQLHYAVPWFDTYNTVAVRKAIEDQVQAILSGKTTPADAVMTAQKNADELLRPYVEETALKRLT
jgi:ABC-type glycerol-3-phosphate transport system substrate-binding protein